MLIIMITTRPPPHAPPLTPPPPPPRLMSDPDSLYSLRSYYYLGHFTLALDESKTLPRQMPAELKAERDEFIMRSHMGLGDYQTVNNAVSASSSAGLQGIKLLSTLLSDPTTAEAAAKQGAEWLTDSSMASSKMLQLCVATVFMHAENMKEALKIAATNESLEHMALAVQVSPRPKAPPKAQVGASRWPFVNRCLTPMLPSCIGLAFIYPLHSLPCLATTILPTNTTPPPPHTLPLPAPLCRSTSASTGPTWRQALYSRWSLPTRTLL